jgi:hypothetical protein
LEVRKAVLSADKYQSTRANNVAEIKKGKFRGPPTKLGRHRRMIASLVHRFIPFVLACLTKRWWPQAPIKIAATVFFMAVIRPDFLEWKTGAIEGSANTAGIYDE